MSRIIKGQLVLLVVNITMLVVNALRGRAFLAVLNGAAVVLVGIVIAYTLDTIRTNRDWEKLP